MSEWKRASVYLTDANGAVYLAELSGVWDAPPDDRRAVYYDGERRPEGCVPLFRLTLEPEQGE